MSSANIFGLAILENPRQESGAPASGKGVVFDAQFYLGPGEVAVGCLRYFNDADIAFDEGGTYFVCTTVGLACFSIIDYYLLANTCLRWPKSFRVLKPTQLLPP